MADQEIEDRILQALEKGAEQEDLDIVSVEVCGPATHPILRVRVDLLEDGPIDMDRVTEITPWVSSIIEDIDPFPGAYELEVSSPGIDRPLRRPRDYQAQVGEQAEVTTSEPIDGRKVWTGEILRADDEGVTLRVNGEDRTLPYGLIKRAKIKPDYAKILADAKKAEKAAKAAE